MLIAKLRVLEAFINVIPNPLVIVLSLNNALPLVFHSHSEFLEDHDSRGATLPSIV